MKRFYCTICKKVKRVRKLPAHLTPSPKVSDRIGVCNWHFNPLASDYRTLNRKVGA